MSSQPHHDRYVRSAFQKFGLAAPFFKANLPAAMVADLDWDHLEQQPTSLIDPKLKETLCDLLYTIRIKERKEKAYIYLLFEHKSSPSTDLCWMMFHRRYLLMEKHVREHGPAKLPMVLPLLLYHGDKTSLGPLDIADRTSAPESMHPYRISAPLFLVNLNEVDNEKLQRDHLLYLFQLILKNIRSPLLQPSLWENIPLMVELSDQRHGREFLIESFRYVLNAGYSDTNPDEIRAMVQALPKEIEEQTVGKIAENFVNYGKNLAKQEIASSLIQKGLELGLVQETTGLDLTTLHQIRDNHGPILRHWY